MISALCTDYIIPDTLPKRMQKDPADTLAHDNAETPTLKIYTKISKINTHSVNTFPRQIISISSAFRRALGIRESHFGLHMFSKAAESEYYRGYSSTRTFGDAASASPCWSRVTHDGKVVRGIGWWFMFGRVRAKGW